MPAPRRIIVDANIPAAEACFGELGEVRRLPGRQLPPEALAEAEVLITRSITRVDRALLDQAPRLRFVGTCTIGTDHIDRQALAERGIGFSSAPGCNAEAVVDHVLGALTWAAEREGQELEERRVGIVGVGQVGGRLAARLAALGIETLCCDPPRAEAEGSEGFHDLETLIERCDVLCLHTPLVWGGPHATHHLLDARRLAALRPGTWLLNAGRGDCLDGEALQARLAARGDLLTLLDVWENEPAIDEVLWRAADLATPHVAGYSLDGKLRGTHQVYGAAMHHFGLPARRKLASLLPSPALPRLTLDAGLSPWDALRLCIRACHDPRRDALGLARFARERGMARGFDGYRAAYPLRREFATLTVELREGAADLAPWLEGAGFRVEHR
ncbi:4-phosphoerythronate dehydrogenase PdxB [Bisbaumannia pacifica]|uniref:Erythronate-4-phosphate dehydrogenase n=1 Tax=Bisbaumannia pacifica TaxID=77098 RepID=A0ABD4L1G8_9GAMM|nr:4-phosphoerythronate dehydrogenase PdxB [Halomonas pacifica]MBH8580133.1 4-phosphoerythronate dehydrogenase PdxB [Halomonas pacifica]